MDNKKRICILLDDIIKKEWQEFAQTKNISTISKLIRQSVEFYIDFYSRITDFESISQFVHDLKEPLTSIKGFSEILMNDYKNELSLDALLKIKYIFDQSEILEDRIEKLSEKSNNDIKQKQILIVDDDNFTLKLLANNFEKKGIKCMKAINGTQAIEILNKLKPRFILLDIMLPDISGYEICKKIKSNENTSNIKVYYITAIPEIEVKNKLKETGADGYFTKPFKMNEFDPLLI
ncbi:MAG: response regulator [Promethearchaeota archaeon]